MVLDCGGLADSGGLLATRGRSGVLEHIGEGWWGFGVPGRGGAHRRLLSTVVDLGLGAATAEAQTRSRGATGGSMTSVALGVCSGRRDRGSLGQYTIG
jgi:hypothetical protein